MINWFYDCYQILNKVYSDKTFVKQAISSTFIEEKNRALTVKTVYGVLDKDIELSYYISALCDKNPKLAIRTILKISLYAIKYLDKHGYAVTKNAVELTKKLGKGGAAGFVNAFLRKYLSTEIPLPKDEFEMLSVKNSYPLFMVKEIVSDYGEQRAEKIMAAENAKTSLVFYETDGEEYLKEKGYAYQKTPLNNVYLLDNFVRNEDYDKGVYTYQAIGSAAICDMVEPCEKLLDCCAAPGGKSIRLSYKCDEVYSCDVYPHRVELINEYAERMKRKNIRTFILNGKENEPSFNDFFDAVLCDAPCSGSGVMNDNPDIKLNRQEENVTELCAEQIKILDNVCKYVKVGGYLYYSTCSLFKRENGKNVERFLKNHDNFVPERVNSPLPCEKDGESVMFLPDISGGNGFFFAKLKRVK